MDEVIQFLFNTNHEFSLTTFIVIVVICLITTTVTRYFGERRKNSRRGSGDGARNKPEKPSGREEGSDKE